MSEPNNEWKNKPPTPTNSTTKSTPYSDKGVDNIVVKQGTPNDSQNKGS